MRVSYFGYSVRHIGTGEYWLVDLRDFVSGFVAADESEIKNGLTYNGEQIFLLPHKPPVYLFVQARDHEIIKAIRKREMSVEDIHAALNGASVGFASYVLMGEHWFGIGCRVLSPRVNAFAAFVQDVFQALRVPYQFSVQALTEQIPKSHVQKLYQVNSVSIGMEIENGLARHIYNLLTGGSDAGLADVANMEVTIRRRRKGNHSIKDSAQAIVNSVPDEGLESLEAKAKKELSEGVTDVYIVGQGGLRDFVPGDSEAHIAEQMQERAAGNSVLRDKLGEIRGDENFNTAVAPRELGLDWESAIARYVRPAAARRR